MHTSRQNENETSTTIWWVDSRKGGWVGLPRGAQLDQVMSSDGAAAADIRMHRINC